MKRGLKLWSINTDFYLKEAVKLYENGIFDYIELYVVPESLETLSAWKKLNIPFIIHNSHFAQGFNLAKSEKAQRNREIYEQTKHFADELNAKYIIFHGGIDGNIEETAKQLASFKEQRALIENKPYVALPNRMGGEFCRGYSVDEIKTVMEVANCGFCFDFGHAICAANSMYDMNYLSPQPYPSGGEGAVNYPPLEGVSESLISGKGLSRHEFIYSYLETFLPMNPNMFHLTDINDITSPYDSHPHLGTGQLDFKRIFDMIPYDSYITFETVKNSKENLNDFVEDMKWLRNFQ